MCKWVWWKMYKNWLNRDRTSTLTVDTKVFDRSSFGFDDPKREPETEGGFPEGGGADAGDTAQDEDDAMEFDNEHLPDDSSLFGVLYHRYRHVKDS